MTRRSLLALGATAAASRLLGADDPPYHPAPENLRARDWFQDAKFGLFIHWGVYSVLGKGEWVMNNTQMSVREYEKLPAQFNPVKYDPAEWVTLARQAGMRYITITSKHHDGFAMFGTKQSKWSIVDASPYGKDVLKPLSEECRRQGLRLFFYHSHLDWHHPDYYPLGRTGHYSGRPEGGDFNRYLDYMDAQLTELLTGYGDIAGIWFDGIWDRRDADWRLRRTYDLIHTLRPAALVGNNHHLTPFAGEDFQMFEKDLPGKNTAGFNAESKIGNLPLETCETISGAWGYNSDDRNFKSTEQLIHYLAKAAGNNANFLLNVGPKPDGTIQDEFRTRLQEMGTWLGKNGESIYGTRGGPITPRPWGVTTQRANKTYLHVLDWPDNLLVVQGLPKPVKKASLLSSGRPVKLQLLDGGLLLDLPKADRDPIDTVVVLES
ncbi:MAG TPA: alpha-L-fucosidase [Bryobacteraceae bacterium]|nr:alpha-L-fucosidase [Bryobacteraceae bacterium]